MKTAQDIQDEIHDGAVLELELAVENAVQEALTKGKMSAPLPYGVFDGTPHATTVRKRMLAAGYRISQDMRTFSWDDVFWRSKGRKPLPPPHPVSLGPG